ncbi:hypothetical protein CALVIDRAFT_595699 [Calocera viscosa TUFC12733]|uniref:Uncharacterized protein n=1 Tax=Calocera viscosa (strain TUFC12733) TaxID=1330018 RepID=A0A167QA41_CALVF|nr:hypothetical protein CALVIDRAFT_595699 [Calocera viscosa TUFC12733]
MSLILWDGRTPFKSPFGRHIPIKDHAVVVDGVSTNKIDLDYYAIIAIFADMKKLRLWYTEQGGKDKLLEQLHMAEPPKKTGDDQIISLLNAVLKPIRNGFVLAPVGRLAGTPYLDDYLCYWTIQVGIPPIGALSRRLSAEERVEVFFNYHGVTGKMDKLSTVFGQEFCAAMFPAALMGRTRLQRYIRIGGYGETRGAGGASTGHRPRSNRVVLTLSTRPYEHAH